MDKLTGYGYKIPFTAIIFAGYKNRK